MQLSLPRPMALAALLALALAAPFLASSYQIFQLSMVLIYAVALFGLNILTGYNGQISLGHGAFYALGAYTAAILIDRHLAPDWVAVPAAGLVCLAVGTVFGLSAARLFGLYLALASYALAIITPQVLKFNGLAAWTGGSQGLILDKPGAPRFLPLDADQWLYLCLLGITVLLFVFGRNILAGRIGRALVAIRDHPIAAASMGIDTTRYKALTFGLSAAYTGVAGALGALTTGFVSPDSFDSFLSLRLLVGIVIGGIGSISGAFFGAAFIEFIPNLAERFSKAAPWTIYGVLLILVTYLMPGGVAGLLRTIARRVKVAAQTAASRRARLPRQMRRVRVRGPVQ